MIPRTLWSSAPASSADPHAVQMMPSSTDRSSVSLYKTPLRCAVMPDNNTMRRIQQNPTFLSFFLSKISSATTPLTCAAMPRRRQQQRGRSIDSVRVVFELICSRNGGPGRACGGEGKARKDVCRPQEAERGPATLAQWAPEANCRADKGRPGREDQRECNALVCWWPLTYAAQKVKDKRLKAAIVKSDARARKAAEDAASAHVLLPERAG
jgi:hypothetical protein